MPDWNNNLKGFARSMNTPTNMSKPQAHNTYDLFIRNPAVHHDSGPGIKHWLQPSPNQSPNLCPQVVCHEIQFSFCQLQKGKLFRIAIYIMVIEDTEIQ